MPVFVHMPVHMFAHICVHMFVHMFVHIVVHMPQNTSILLYTPEQKKSLSAEEKCMCIDM